MSKTRDTGYLANVIQVHDTGVRIMSGSTMLMAVSSSGAVTITGEISGSDAANALLLSGTGSVGFTTTSSFLAVSSSQQQVSASYIALSASYNTFSGSASTRITANSSSIQQVSSSQQDISSSLLQVSASYTALSGSYTTFSGSASTRTTQIENVFATTGSNSFRADQSITGSLVVSSTITAQTLVVQTVTSSIVYSSGSNIFGNQLSNTQTFTGSVNITGSITQTGANTTASFASSVGIGTNTIINRLTLAGGSDGLTNMLGVYNNGINNLTAIGKGSAIILGGNTDGNYSAKIAMVYEGENPSYLQPALAFYTMRDTFAYGSEVERMRITSAGNVGIGTSSPNSYSGYTTLTINNTTTGAVLDLNRSGTRTGTFYADTSGVGIGSLIATNLDIFTGNSYIAFQTCGLERMRIASGGNVGIGTCTPTGTYGKLSVAGGISILNNNCAKLEIGRYSSSSTDSYIVMASGSTGLTFTNAGDIADVMRITTGGNVGIGTCAPSFRLQVQADDAGSYNQASGQFVISGATNTNKRLNIGYNTTNNIGWIQPGINGTGYSHLALNPLGCNVGIGIATPVDTLDVMGALRVRCNTPGFTIACNSLVIDYANTCVFGSAPMTRYYSIGCTGVSAGHTFLVGEPSVGYNAFIINGSGHVTKPCSAAFHAAINSSTCIGSGGTVIKFNCVIYNAGGGYNGTTSTFTAPVSGMYQFNFTFLNQNVQNVDGGHAYLLTSSGVGTYYFTRYGCFSGTDRTGYGNYVPMHGAIAVYLPGGATACVAAFWDGPGAFTHNSTAWSNFTGYLVG